MSRPALALEEAQARLLALVEPLRIERVDVAGALGRYLAQPLVADRTQPARDLSAMDGYAVSAGDLTGPWQVIGESAAGHPFCEAIQPGQAVRISTGAVLPDGAAAVIVQEDVVRDGASLRMIGTPPSPADHHIRRAGNDFAEGDVLIPLGARVTPAVVALALTAGLRHLPVRRTPRIALIDCGDELAADPDCCAPYQVPASNAAMLQAMLAALPCDASRIGPVRDQAIDLRAALEAASQADVIVTTGGASVGDHDIVRPVLADWGASLDFWRVAIKPGKPLLVATRGKQIILGLPGNPVSSHVTGFLFLLPLARALLGAEAPLAQSISTTLADTLAAAGARREFVRGRWDGEQVWPEAVRDSGALAGMARSNVLIDVAANTPLQNAGSAVRIYLLENGAIA